MSRIVERVSRVAQEWSGPLASTNARWTSTAAKHDTNMGIPTAAFGVDDIRMSALPSSMRKNRVEQRRLQGLMRTDTVLTETGHRSNRGTWTMLRQWAANEGSRSAFYSVWLVLHALLFAFGLVNYHFKDNLVNARRQFGWTFQIARAAALVLHVDVALILLPVCRTFISFLRRGPLNDIIPFEDSLVFHIATAWSIVFFTCVHVIAHLFNAWWLAVLRSPELGSRVISVLGVNFATGPGVTGWIMTFALGLMVWFAMDKRRRANYERFYGTHHLFVVLFACWQLHGMFCFIRWSQIGVFWKYWLVGGTIYIVERALREYRSRQRTYISKVVLHPSHVVEVQIKKPGLRTRAGQYVFLNCPEISYWQWHPFTLTSSPEEDHISVHVRCVGDWTRSLAAALGCQLDSQEGSGGDTHRQSDLSRPTTGSSIVPLHRVLPRLMVDGPFGSASEDVLGYEVSMLVGAGIGVTPFASVLKSIWYRLKADQEGRPALKDRLRLSKVYFFWICRDYDSFEWFQSLLSAIEEQDLQHRIEIHTYLTSRVTDDDVHNILAQDVGNGERDAVTQLRAPTHYGRPQWPRIFSAIATRHPATDVGVFFCGPKPLAHDLHAQCKMHSQTSRDGVKFHWGKENF